MLSPLTESQLNATSFIFSVIIYLKENLFIANNWFIVFHQIHGVKIKLLYVNSSTSDITVNATENHFCGDNNTSFGEAEYHGKNSVLQRWLVNSVG